jgi:branched-chain amino acid transport system permease protein
MLLESLILGFLLGGLYGILGIGLSLIFAGTEIIYMVYGDIIILGSYLSLIFVGFLGIDPLLTIVIIAPILFGIGWVVQYTLLNKALRMGLQTALLMTIGLSVIIENVLQVCMGTNLQSLAVYTTYGNASIEVGGISIPFVYLLNFSVNIVVMVALYLFLKHTYMGRAFRATSEDRRAAQLMGVNTDNIYACVVGAAAVVAAVVGVLIGLSFPFDPFSGSRYLIICFGVMIIGGAGSMRGALIGGQILGLSQVLSANYIGPQYQLFIGYLVLLVALAIMPEGIFKRKV